MVAVVNNILEYFLEGYFTYIMTSVAYLVFIENGNQDWVDKKVKRENKQCFKSAASVQSCLFVCCMCPWCAC